MPARSWILVIVAETSPPVLLLSRRLLLTAGSPPRPLHFLHTHLSPFLQPADFFFLYFCIFHRTTRVRSLAMLFSDCLTDSLPFSKLDWRDPGVWRRQIKTCWGCYCCWFWWWGSCWQQFDAYLGVQARFLSWILVNMLLLIFCRGYEVESWSRCWS